MRILNLYAGIGGNRKMWGDNHEITAVELDPNIAGVYQDLYPNDKVTVGDAHDYLLQHYAEFDFIWSSPPCQSHSRMVKFTRHKVRKYPDLGLYEEIIFLSNFFSGEYVVENVIPYYSPLLEPTCKIGRHCLWANFFISPLDIKTPKGFIKKGTTSETQELKDWLGIQYDGNIYYEGNHCPGQVLRNCVHPTVGLHILNCATKKETSQEQMPLFQSNQGCR